MKPNQKRAQRFRVASRFKKMVQSVRYKSSPYTARTFAKAPTLRRALVKVLCKHITRECAALSSMKIGKSGKSALQLKSPEQLKTFQWALVENEKKAPVLL